ncbi:enoyl-CoA delta isomerase 1, mitochondrial-like isoform X2 [Bacillus rossius redtenbacheri]|uniref:enoyl-CoA delta isomerase 1, mitochondrial-like isoform X2 n=1 Tax=Bacillus rossius redtenbacheri TaxID=93214 RepID=UPI002FDE470E
MALSGRIWPRLASEMRRVLPLAAARDLSSAQKFLDVAVNEKTGVSTVTMQRPPVNSLNLELLQELARTLDRLRSDNSRGMILTSASQTIFSAGLDLFEMYKPDQERVRAFWTVLQDMWLSLYTTPFPTVAVINGHSPAGGCLLAMSCEYRIMLGPRFTIGLNETQLGLVAPKWFMDVMTGTVPRREAELALTTGRLYTTEEALQSGLVDEVASDKADGIGRAEAFLARVSKIPAMGRSRTKLMFRQGPASWLRENRQLDLEEFLRDVEHPAVQKTLGAYIESLKRK